MTTSNKEIPNENIINNWHSAHYAAHAADSEARRLLFPRLMEREIIEEEGFSVRETVLAFIIGGIIALSMFLAVAESQVESRSYDRVTITVPRG